MLKLVVCPECGGRKFKVREKKRSPLECREGTVKCLECSKEFKVNKGITDFLVEHTEEIMKEQKAWMKEQKAKEKIDLKEFLLSLPRPENREDREWWAEQADNYEMVMEELKLKGTETVLDLGAGRCWSTRDFAKKGCYAVGIDIVKEKFVGLESADLYLKNGQFFERMLADMNKLPFADKSFDVVFSTATLHHCSDLRESFKEISRVLKKKGKLVLVNEPVRGIFESKRVEHRIADLGANEHKYSIPEWTSALKEAGFTYRIFFPRNVENMMATGKVKGGKGYKVMLGRIASGLWGNRVGRILLEKVFHLPGQWLIGMGLALIAEKKA